MYKPEFGPGPTEFWAPLPEPEQGHQQAVGLDLGHGNHNMYCHTLSTPECSGARLSNAPCCLMRAFGVAEGGGSASLWNSITYHSTTKSHVVVRIPQSSHAKKPCHQMWNVNSMISYAPLTHSPTHTPTHPAPPPAPTMSS